MVAVDVIIFDFVVLEFIFWSNYFYNLIIPVVLLLTKVLFVEPSDSWAGEEVDSLLFLDEMRELANAIFVALVAFLLQKWFDDHNH